MSIRLQGIAAVAEQKVHLHPEGRFYLRRSLPMDIEVPLYIYGSERDKATSIYVRLQRLGGYLVADAELPETEEGEWIYDLVVGGQHALTLKTTDEEGYYKGKELGFQIEKMKVWGVTLDVLAASENCFAWIEDNEHISYELTHDLFVAVQEYHETTGDAEPTLDHVPLTFRESQEIDPPEQVPQGPSEGDNVSYLKLVRSQGQVDLLISNQGTLVSKVRAGPALIESLRDMIADYDQSFPNVQCEPLDDGDEP